MYRPENALSSRYSSFFLILLIDQIVVADYIEEVIYAVVRWVVVPKLARGNIAITGWLIVPSLLQFCRPPQRRRFVNVYFLLRKNLDFYSALRKHFEERLGVGRKIMLIKISLKLRGDRFETIDLKYVLINNRVAFG